MRATDTYLQVNHKCMSIGSIKAQLCYLTFSTVTCHGPNHSTNNSDPSCFYFIKKVQQDQFRAKNVNTLHYMKVLVSFSQLQDHYYQGDLMASVNCSSPISECDHVTQIKEVIKNKRIKYKWRL